MNPDQLLYYAVFSLPVFALLCLVLGLVFFLSLKRQGRRLAEQTLENTEALERLTRMVSVLGEFSLESLDNRITELENRKPLTVTEPASPGFVGASRRGQVLRLHRNGESSVNIAEALGVSQGEVNLTLELQHLFAQTVP